MCNICVYFNTWSLFIKNFLLESMTLSDKLLITSSVDALCLQNILTYDEVVNICLGHIQSKKNFLDDKLEILVSGVQRSLCTVCYIIVFTSCYLHRIKIQHCYIRYRYSSNSQRFRVSASKIYWIPRFNLMTTVTGFDKSWHVMERLTYRCITICITWYLRMHFKLTV